MLESSDGRLARLSAANQSPGQILDELYWAALSRAPTTEEQTVAEQALAGSTDDEWLAALQDLAWAILNSKEFVFRH
jgi:hypothetical protein